MHRSLIRACLFAALLPLAVFGADFQTPAISPDELHERLQNEPTLLVVDVRSPVEFRVGHVPGAINLPASEIVEHLDAVTGRSGVVLYCIAGTRTQLAEQTLLVHEVPGVLHLQGGLTGWLDKGFPVEKGPGAKLAHSAGAH